jgi:small GTP-binding protein
MLKKKVCLVGSFGVGKTSLVAQFVSGIFSDKYLTTIGVKIDKKLVSLEAGDLQLMLWDMAGEERFEHLQTSYLRGAAGLIFVADGTRAETLDRAVEYAGEVQALESGAVPVVVLVNKSDLTADWEVGAEGAVAERVGGLPFVLTSAKTGENVEAAFAQLCEAMLSNHG